MKNRLIKLTVFIAITFLLIVSFFYSTYFSDALILDKYETEYGYYYTYISPSIPTWHPKFEEITVKIGNKISIKKILLRDENKNERKLTPSEVYQYLEVGKRYSLVYTHYKFIIETKKLKEIRELNKPSL